MVALFSLMLSLSVFGILGSDLLQIIHDSCSEVDSNSSDFWVMVAALKVRHYNLTLIFDVIAHTCFPIVNWQWLKCNSLVLQSVEMMLLGLYHERIDKLVVDFRETEIGQMCIMVDNFTIGKIWITNLCFFGSPFSLREHHVYIISKLLVWTKVWGKLWMSRSCAYSLEVLCNHLIRHYAWKFAHEFSL